jgi:hypothetical protein
LSWDDEEIQIRFSNSHFDVIVRLDRTIQYSETSELKQRSHRVLDAPHSRGMTMEYCEETYIRVLAAQRARALHLVHPSP